MSDDRHHAARAQAERDLRLALAAEARRARALRTKIKTWFYVGVALLAALFVAAMLLT